MKQHTYVPVNAQALRSALKARKGSPIMVMALSGYTTSDVSQFNTWLRNGHLPTHVADALLKYFGIDLYEKVS